MTKKIVLLIFLSLFIFYSCVTEKNTNLDEQLIPDLPINEQIKDLPVNEPLTEPSVLTTQETDNAIIAEFDTIKITKKTFESTKTAIELVVDNLNKITITRDYQKWLPYLSKEYKDFYSSPVVLNDISENLPIKGIKLKNLKDYFNYVFVPSRQNMRVDDIKFVSPTRVYVIMEIAPGSPAAIYILEKTTEGWNLVLKNQ